MTTTVKVQCVSSNPGKGIVVEQSNGPPQYMAPGDENTFYVHDSNTMTINEVYLPDKAAGDQQEAPADKAPAETDTSG